MTKFILHGGFTREDNELNRSFLREITKDLPESSKILLVMFAVDDDKVNDKFKFFSELLDKNANGKHFEYVLATKQDFSKQVSQANAVYLQGGDTAKFRDTLDEYPGFEKDIQGKVVAGSSAGAYVLSKVYFSVTQGGIMEGIGILPVKTVCHYQSKIQENRDKGPEELEALDDGLELVVLKDFEWKTFEVE